MLRRTVLAILCSVFLSPQGNAEDFDFILRYQTPISQGNSNYHQLTRAEQWAAERTALIVCDVWDTHNCKNAALRVGELAPRLNAVVAEARRQGALIIHAPSNCMAFYENHPARKRAIEAPAANAYPQEITQWCYQIPAEEKGVYPIDQTNGGCDDDPEEHAQWQASLKPLLEEEKWPWRREHPAIEIDESLDYVTDKGDEVWNILESHGIENVIMTGVHTNMCVLGRPFGLRRLVLAGKNAVLMRDQTDTMYDPRSAPYVSHFTGTDLIISHIERHVCPTITSDQLIGGSEFRFAKDQRPHVAIIMAEDEYQTETTLPPFAIDPLGKEFRVTLIHANPDDRNHIPGIEAVRDADCLLVSVRRRVLPTAELQIVKEFVAAGKPVVGIRTASHAFALRNDSPPTGYADWPEFDAQVFGGNYHNHYGNDLKCTAHVVDMDHPILKGIAREDFPAGGSLYRTAPLKPGATILMTGTIADQPGEPLAWTFVREDGGRSFYTSLGHVDDFQQPVFRQMLTNAIRWTLEEK